jgi:hypothetical protein
MKIIAKFKEKEKKANRGQRRRKRYLRERDTHRRKRCMHVCV